MNNAFETLSRYNIKPSPQRMAIMTYLLEHKTHPTIEEIYKSLSPDMPTLSKTTIYNTLKLFVENGAASMLTINEKTTHLQEMQQGDRPVLRSGKHDPLKTGNRR